jgi:predicted RNA methylase
MTAKRAPDFDLDKAIEEVGFTPRVADVPRLLALLAGGGEKEDLAERALLRVGLPAARAAVRGVADGEPAERAARTRFVGRVASATGDEELAAFLIERLGDGDARVRRLAAVALGKTRGDAAEAALSEALAGEAAPDARRAMAAALGKVGGEKALEALGAAKAEGEAADPRFERERARATLIASRTLGRAEPSAFDPARPARAPTPVVLRCRAGLAQILLGELDADLGARVVPASALGGLRVEATLRGPPARLFQARTMLSFGFPLPVQRLSGDPECLALAVTAALTSPQALAVLERWTDGPVRYRIAWAGGGKRRAAVWRIATLVAERRPELVNDPTESPWEAVVYEGGGAVLVELRPRVDDPRFAYRRGDVPAASHPTIAAALVRVAGAFPDDVVWDPFTGSGTELCERALAGGYRRLVGSDVDPRALAVARENLAAAGARAELVEADACTFVPAGAAPTVILTNPPLGRRVHRSADLAPMLDRFVEHAARTLAPGGRFVWVSPFARRTEAAGVRAGLSLELAQEIDLGGFGAELQAFRKGRRG